LHSQYLSRLPARVQSPFRWAEADGRYGHRVGRLAREVFMPLVEVTLTQGRSSAQLRSLIHELHEAVVRAVDAPPANVRVIVREVPPANWASGDVTIEEKQANQA
jgi:4-oxalocrotonate tautomerase